MVPLFLLALVCVQACMKYTCKEPESPVSSSTCAYFDRSTSAWYLQACSHGYVCPPPDTVNFENSYCEWPQPAMKPQAYPGEPCYYDSDCELFISEALGCVKGLCAGKASEAACTSTLECSPGLTCFSNRCGPQVTSTGMCFADTDCENQFGCDIPLGAQSGHCIKYLSVAVNQTVSSCPGPQFEGETMNFLNLLCKGGSCAYDHVKGAMICVEAFQSKGKLPLNCTDNLQFVASSTLGNQDIYSTCASCGYNFEQTTFCNLLPGDPLFQDLLSLTEDWFSSSALQKCNSARRWDCMQSIWSHYEEWAYYKAATDNYALLVGAEDCVAQVLFPIYFALQQDESLAAQLSAAVLIFLI